MIGAALGRVPIPALFYGGAALGGCVAVDVAVLGHHRGMTKGHLAFVGGSAVLAGSGLLGAMRFERTVGPFVDRYAVDGVEQITRRAVNLDWASKSGRFGAIVSGIGCGAMMVGNFTML